MFEFDILEVKDFSVIKHGAKIIYNTDGIKNYLDVIKDKTKHESKKIEFPQMYGSVNVRKNGSGVFYPDSLGFFVCEGDTVESNPSSVFIISGASYRNRGIDINKGNFIYIMSYFAARKSILADWKNQKDSYIFNESQIKNEYVYDTIVYGLFNSSSQQSSLRQVTYKDKLWDIKNEFFWMSVEEMKQLADDNGYDNLYNDARTSPNRHVYDLLFGEERIYDKLSPDAKLVLDKASELVRKSIQARQLMSDNENHLDSWDAGYAQLKLVWKEYFSEDFKEFRQMYKNLEDRMRPLVYELGFLMK